MEQEPIPLNNPPKNSPSANSSVELLGRTRLGLLIISILFLTILGRACFDRPSNPSKEIVIENPPSQGVKLDDTGRDTKKVSKRHFNTTRTSVSSSNKYIPPEGSVTISPRDPQQNLSDLIRIHYQEFGFIFEPGLEFSGNLYSSYGLDAKLFYAHRFGVGAGIVTGSNVVTVVSPDVFFSYRLDQLHLRNTEAVFTYVPLGKIAYGIGLRINL